MQVKLKKGQYFEHGDKYFVEFQYEREEQQNRMFELFEKGLLPSYGSNSTRTQEDKDCIMPYMVDENGDMTIEDTGKIGGTSIPEDLLPEFIRRFVEVDGAVVKIGDEQIKGHFDYDQFDGIIGEFNGHKIK